MGAPLNHQACQSAPAQGGSRPSQSSPSTSASPSTLPSTLPTYLSLVQQYLSVFMVDNATFLAERCVAEHPHSAEAVYMLALCYYRSSSPKRARLLLEQLASPALTPAMRFLAAQCSYELKDYSRAEDALLKECRLLYQRYHRGSGGSGVTGAADMATSASCSMDDWIVQTTPCPVPNGAAGLALLGKICRKSNRKERAINYFKMSLQLDPFLWTSFEALAELGCCGGGGDDLNARAIFGVEQQQQHSHFLTTTTTTSPSLVSSVTPAAPNALSFSSAAATATFPPPPTSVLRNRTLLLETPGLTPIPAASNSFHNIMYQPTPLAHSLYPPSASTTNTTVGVANNHNTTATNTLPSQPASLLLQTPPPLPSQGQPNINNHNNSNTLVLRRARDVALRNYYPPSPETPVTQMTRSIKYLKGLGPSSSSFSVSNNSRINFSANINYDDTVATMGGAGGGAVAGRSSLFMSTENQSSSFINAAIATAGTTATTTTSYNNPNHSLVPPVDEKEKQRENSNNNNTTTNTTNNVTSILELLSVLGAAYQHICAYQCKDALQLLQSLPQKHQLTGWVLHQQGRAFLELNNFHDAKRTLELMQAKDPGRLRGLELLSTVYWQLKKEVELSYLSQRVVDMDRLSPVAWCVVGNCFSLQKDHESALIFFKRSLQLDYDFTYTHTLSGYEFMANEDFDKAIACFRQALRIDDRHYNAWYGLGAIYHRQEKYDQAEIHFQKAVSINPSSSVLRCNLGIAQNANGKPYQALDTLEGAFQLDPRNPQARFQRATIYSALNRPEEALLELQKVRDAAPREATIHFAMGKVLKRLGRPEEAMKCFLTAMDLDPKDNQMIKSAMDKLDEPDVDEETMSAF